MTRPPRRSRGSAVASRLSHVDSRGQARMVDVGDKPVTAREAVARGMVTMSQEALRQIGAGAIKKGDPLQVARLAGIMAAKRTAELIPLCHPLALAHVDVDLRRRRFTAAGQAILGKWSFTTVGPTMLVPAPSADRMALLVTAAR